jgi:hypothetical protein
MHLRPRPLLNATLPLHVAGLVLAALLERPPMVTVPMAIVVPIEAHLLTVVVLLHQGVLLKPQLFVLLPHFHVKSFFMLIISRRRPIPPTYLVYLD